MSENPVHCPECHGAGYLNDGLGDCPKCGGTGRKVFSLPFGKPRRLDLLMEIHRLHRVLERISAGGFSGASIIAKQAITPDGRSKP